MSDPDPQDEPARQPVSEAILPGSEVEPDEQLVLDIDAFPGGLRSALEAVLMVVDEPVAEVQLASVLEQPVEHIHGHLVALEREYAAEQRGFTLRHVAGGWRFYSRSELAPVVEKFLLDGQQAKLTQASLETLAVIAYRQPVSRSRVSAVRGVNVDGVVRTLVSRGLIEEVGEPEESGAVLYGTTTYFMQRMGLDSLDDLPALAPYLPDVDVIDELIEEGHA